MQWRATLGPVVAAVALVGSAIFLSGCGDDGDALAQQACTYVKHSITLIGQARQADPKTAASLRVHAYADLRTALPIAASANSANGEWNALMTTISESARVPITHLVVALRAQCRAADANNQNAPAVPTTIPGANGGPANGSPANGSSLP